MAIKNSGPGFYWPSKAGQLATNDLYLSRRLPPFVSIASKLLQYSHLALGSLLIILISAPQTIVAFFSYTLPANTLPTADVLCWCWFWETPAKRLPRPYQSVSSARESCKSRNPEWARSWVKQVMARCLSGSSPNNRRIFR